MRVYVSVLGDEADRDRTLAGLTSSHGLLQAEIARELRMKRTPTLEFVYDDYLIAGCESASCSTRATTLEHGRQLPPTTRS